MAISMITWLRSVYICVRLKDKPLDIRRYLYSEYPAQWIPSQENVWQTYKKHRIRVEQYPRMTKLLVKMGLI